MNLIEFDFFFTNTIIKKYEFCRFVTMICTSLERPMPVNGERKLWHEWPAIVKSNLKTILVFVKHPL